MNIVPSRVFSGLYILIDVIFLTLLAAMLFFSKRRRALYFGLFGGVLYFLVDWGIFYLALGARTVTGAPTAPFLLWLSMSYGFTNFAWIWLMLDKDQYRVEWSALIFFAWMAEALLSQNFGASWPVISISRTTTSYHGAMALILVVGYFLVAVENIFFSRKINVPYLLFIGITVQLGWETALLVTGIRQSGIETLVVNSLIETNLGMPYIWHIFSFVEKKWGKEEHF
ncbi:MAG: hypothetical protein ACI4S4_04545, partial [Candidatus Ornithospirochaeta sp.]